MAENEVILIDVNHRSAHSVASGPGQATVTTYRIGMIDHNGRHRWSPSVRLGSPIHLGEPTRIAGKHYANGETWEYRAEPREGIIRITREFARGALPPGVAAFFGEPRSAVAKPFTVTLSGSIPLVETFLVRPRKARPRKAKPSRRRQRRGRA